MLLDPFLKQWTVLNKKQIGVQEREAPLRDELYTRLLIFAVALLALQFALLWWEGIRAWGRGPVGFAFLTAFPAAYLLAAFLTRKHPFRFAGLFTAIVLTVTLPIAPASVQAFPYPQFGGALVLTIVLSGLLVGKTYVRIWTIACVMVQFSDQTHSWRVNALWALLHVTAGWLVTLFSWHVERLNAAARVAEEQQRNAIVAERTRFARDIHDTLAQGFTGIMMQLNAAEQRLRGDSVDARTHIEKARQLASESLEEARRSIGALRAGTLSSGGLLDAIEQIGRKLTSDSGVQLEANLEGQPYALPEQCEANLLRIAQEALTNAVRHSGTERINIRLAYRTGSVVLEVGDRGQGMSGREPSGFGVDGMRERARQLGGEIQILSDPGRGTRIVVTVPNA
ncbi:MAG TPA: sensor histidine kinase [Bryobacteraceae bacterium]|jgi:signal transduction histidine kinase|nr:sensor histidine kinase [Bryobacteraceae bacterium]